MEQTRSSSCKIAEIRVDSANSVEQYKKNRQKNITTMDLLVSRDYLSERTWVMVHWFSLASFCRFLGADVAFFYGTHRSVLVCFSGSFGLFWTTTSAITQLYRYWVGSYYPLLLVWFVGPILSPTTHFFFWFCFSTTISLITNYFESKINGDIELDVLLNLSYN